ncbi:MAG: transcription elongation factor GreAB [Verrucomicrobia bacterium]|nr:transcription elongation factor GreAB [Verrucomicrobiota bacterium]
MQKATVRQAIIDALHAEAESMLGSSKATRATGNDPHSKAEGKYDTRSTEENYLADGLAKQAQAALDAAAAFRELDSAETADGGAIRLGSLVEVEFTDGASEWFFLGPAGGGTEVKCGRREVTVLTPQSPLGGQLLGLQVGGETQAPAVRVKAVQ